MSLHPLAARFAEVADEYELGRPDYTPEVAEAIAAELELTAGDRVLDLAAGTGKLTRALLDWGLDVTAVEPHKELRTVLRARIGSERVVDGLAETIPLPDASVRAVTVADAFHWFDAGAALAEIRRVLEPQGGLALLAMLPDWHEMPWSDDLGRLLLRLRPEHPYFDGPSWQEAVRAAGGWSEPREVQVTATQPATAASIVAYVNSMSWVAAMEPDRRRETLGQVASLVEQGPESFEIGTRVVIGLAGLA